MVEHDIHHGDNAVLMRCIDGGLKQRAVPDEVPAAWQVSLHVGRFGGRWKPDRLDASRGQWCHLGRELLVKCFAVAEDLPVEALQHRSITLLGYSLPRRWLFA